MRHVDIVRAWKDEEYRASLTEQERAQLPDHPAGIIELDEEQMRAVVGQGPTTTATTKNPYCNQ
jgi:mersacidin/lichenicidin family type 2 lantibiotic